MQGECAFEGLVLARVRAGANILPAVLARVPVPTTNQHDNEPGSHRSFVGLLTKPTTMHPSMSPLCAAGVPAMLPQGCRLHALACLACVHRGFGAHT